MTTSAPHPAARQRALRAIALFEAAKGLAALAAVIGLLDLLHHDVHKLVLALLWRFHLDPQTHYPGLLLHYADLLSTLNLRTLAPLALGYITRMTRSFLLWQMRQDYTLVLRLKGLSDGAILWRHALRNAAGPIFAVVALTYAYLLEGAVLTETVFAWPGLGMYITDSLFAADIPAVLTATLVVGLIFMVVNICAELIQSVLDPRTRFQ